MEDFRPDEFIEFKLTKEESRSYYETIYRLKNMQAVDWVKSYIWAVVFAVLFTAIALTFMGDTLMQLVFSMPGFIWLLLFAVLLVISAMIHSKNVVIKSVLKKYVFENMPRELDDDSVTLRRVRIVKNKLIIYYRKEHL